MNFASRSPAVAVMVLTGKSGIRGVRRIHADVARHAGCAGGRPDGAEGVGLVRRHLADVARAPDQRLVGGDDLEVVVRARLEQVDRLADGVRLRVVDVELHAAQDVARVVDAVTRQPLQHVHDHFAVAPRIHEQGVEAALVGGDAEPQQVAVHPLEFGDEHPDRLGARRHLHACQRFDAEGVRRRVHVRADPADPLEHVHRLRPVLSLDALLDPAVHVAEADRGGGHDLAVHRDLEVARFLQGRVLGPDRHHEFPARFLVSVHLVPQNRLSASGFRLPAVSRSHAGRPLKAFLNG